MDSSSEESGISTAPPTKWCNFGRSAKIGVSMYIIFVIFGLIINFVGFTPNKGDVGLNVHYSLVKRVDGPSKQC